MTNFNNYFLDIIEKIDLENPTYDLMPLYCLFKNGKQSIEDIDFSLDKKIDKAMIKSLLDEMIFYHKDLIEENYKNRYHKEIYASQEVIYGIIFNYLDDIFEEEEKVLKKNILDFLANNDWTKSKLAEKAFIKSQNSSLELLLMIYVSYLNNEDEQDKISFIKKIFVSMIEANIMEGKEEVVLEYLNRISNSTGFVPTPNSTFNLRNIVERKVKLLDYLLEVVSKNKNLQITFDNNEYKDILFFEPIKIESNKTKRLKLRFDNKKTNIYIVKDDNFEQYIRTECFYYFKNNFHLNNIDKYNKWILIEFSTNEIILTLSKNITDEKVNEIKERIYEYCTKDFAKIVLEWKHKYYKQNMKHKIATEIAESFVENMNTVFHEIILNLEIQNSAKEESAKNKKVKL